MKRLLPLALVLALPGCGLHPLYAGGGSGAVAQSLQSVSVGPIDGKAGWLVRTALEDRLGGRPGSGARYRLQVLLDDDITAFGIRSDDAPTRERRTLRARYQLIEADRGTVVLDATAGSDVGIITTSAKPLAAFDKAAKELTFVR